MNILTDVENVDNIVVVDWLVFMVLCPEERPGAEVKQRRSYAHILVTEQVTVDGPRLYILEFLYSRQSNRSTIYVHGGRHPDAIRVLVHTFQNNEVRSDYLLYELYEGGDVKERRIIKPSLLYSPVSYG